MHTTIDQHLHVSASGALVLCSFPDLDPDTEYDQLSALLSAQGLPDSGSLDELRHEVITWSNVKPVPVAHMPTCRYVNSEAAEDTEGCDDYRFWLEPWPLTYGRVKAGMVCGQHIVDWTSDHADQGQAWLLKEWQA